MNKDKKIELQAKIINDLQSEKKDLLERIDKLESLVADNQSIVKAAQEYREKHKNAIESLVDAREEYLQAHREMVEQKNKYKVEMDKLLKTIKKNI